MRNGQAIFPSAGGHALAFLDQAQESFRRIAGGVGRGDAQFLQNLFLGMRLESGEVKLCVDGFFQGDRAAPADQEFDGGRGNQRSEQRHDHQRHKHGFANQAKLQREKAQNHFHGTARVHGQAHSPRSAPVHAAQARAHSGAEEFADAGDADDGGGDRQIEIRDEIRAQADAGKKEGSEDVRDDAMDQLGCASAQVCGFAHRDACDERAEYRVNAGVFGEGSCGQSESEDEAEDAAGPAGVRLNMWQELVNQPTDYGKCEHHESDHQHDSALHTVHGCAAAVHHAQDHGEENPADEIVEHRRGHDYGAHFAAEQVQVHQDFSDHGQRGDGKRGADKKRENQAIRIGGGAQEAWEQYRGAEAECERYDYAEETYQQGAFTLAEDTAQVNLESGDEQEKYHAESSNRLEGDGEITGAGKNKCVEIRPEMAQERGTQQNSGHNLAQHRWLVELLHQLAGKFGRAQQHGQGAEDMHYVVWSKMRHAVTPLTREKCVAFVCNMGSRVSQQNAAADMQRISAESRPISGLGFETRLLTASPFALQ